ncbi:MAG: hypothetical protein EOO11_06595 [Chitinophagaceae bacterium]|nr:MAG: hypothetical protein EOO11_06595 [Chitinophagaceae bacterium]
MPQQDATQQTNVSNVQRAAGVCTELGRRYQPVQEFIKPAVLNAYCTDCEVMLTATYNKERDYDEARTARKALFTGLAPFGTRIVNALISCRAPEAVVAEARGLVQDIRGERAGKKPKAAGSATSAEEVAQQISAAQTSFDSRTGHLGKLVQLADRLRDRYTPSAPDLQIAALKERLLKTQEANKAVSDAGAAYSTALIERDRLLYDVQTGLGARLKAIRAEFKSLFGTRSAEYKMLKGLYVTVPRSARVAVPAV